MGGEAVRNSRCRVFGRLRTATADRCDSRYTYSTVAGGLGVRSYRQRFTPGRCRDPLADPLQLGPGQFDGRGLAGVHAVDAADHDDLAELPLSVADAGGLVLQQHGQVLERAAVRQFLLDDRGRRPDRGQPLLGDLADDPRRQGRAGKRDPLGDAAAAAPAGGPPPGRRPCAASAAARAPGSRSPAAGSMPIWARMLCWRLIPATVSSMSVRIVPCSRNLAPVSRTSRPKTLR